MEFSSSEKTLLKLLKITIFGSTFAKMGFPRAMPKTKNIQNQILSFENLFILTKYMFWLSYECFVLCNAFLLKSATDIVYPLNVLLLPSHTWNRYVNSSHIQQVSIIVFIRFHKKYYKKDAIFINFKRQINQAQYIGTVLFTLNCSLSQN